MDEEYCLNLIRTVYAQKFGLFRELLKEYNKMFNITAVCDDEGIIYKHFLDSILPESYFSKGAEVIEIGSGGGFPSLPLKIIRDDLKFTLVESTGKKCVFLKTVVDKLGLGGVQIVNMRAEELAKDPAFRQKFDICTARAVAKLNTLAEYCLPFVKTGGKFIAYKGDCGGEIAGAQRAIEVLGGKIEQTVGYEPQKLGKRTLVMVKKVSATPKNYPRGQGKERKSPIS